MANDPFSGLSEGLQRGFQMGLQMRQQRQSEEEYQRKIQMEKEAQNEANAFKYLDLAHKYGTIKNPTYRKQSLAFFKKAAELGGPTLGIDPNDLPSDLQWRDGFDEIHKELGEALKGYQQFGDKDVFNQALMGIWEKGRQILTDEEMKSLKEETKGYAEDISKRQESSMLAQASIIPSLTERGYLTPEQAQEGQAMALAGAGKAGQDVLEAGIKQQKQKPEQDYVETIVGGVPVKLPVAVFVSHMDREAQREQTRMFHEENLSLRKDLANTANGFRTRLPAAKAQELGAKETTLGKYADLIKSFEDDFGGSIVGGPTMTSLYSVAPAKLTSAETKRRVDWWKNFNALDSEIRHDLFGATLTGYEAKNWDSQTVNENADPAVIRQRLQDRMKYATNAYQRDLESYAQAGYSTGKGVTSIKTAPPPAKGKSEKPSLDKFWR